MKQTCRTRIGALLLSGMLATVGAAGMIPSLSAIAAGDPNEKTADDLINNVTYHYYITGSDSCKLARVTNLGENWALTTKSELTIPSKIPNTNYTIKELGHNGEAFIHSNNANATRLNDLTLPKTVEKINDYALWDTELPNLETLGINLNKLKYCGNAFSSASHVSTLNVFDYNTADYNSVETVEDFETYFDLTNIKFKQYYASGIDSYYISNNASLDGELSFLNAISKTPFSKQLAYKYAQKIANENNFNDPSLSKQKKLEMIFNYVRTHVRYSTLHTTTGAVMGNLKNSALSPLALNSGVCGGYAHEFEMLCRASGFQISNSPQNSEVICINLPSHVANAVRFSPNGKYYILDCTTEYFLMTGHYRNPAEATLSTAYNYGLDVPVSNMTFTKEMLDPNHLNFGGDSYMIIDNKTGKDLDIEVFDKDNPSCKFADYTSHKAPANPGNVSRNILQYHDTSRISTYISSYCYHSMKVGGQTIMLTTTPQATITVNGQQYLVKKEIRTFDYANTNHQRPAENATNLTQAQDPKVAYDNYYYITITKK